MNCDDVLAQVLFFNNKVCIAVCIFVSSITLKLSYYVTITHSLLIIKLQVLSHFHARYCHPVYGCLIVSMLVLSYIILLVAFHQPESKKKTKKEINKETKDYNIWKKYKCITLVCIKI